MARTRLIKPEFFKHGDLFDAERASGLPLRVAFAGLWCQADREGRFAWKPRELKLDVLPYDDVDFAAVLVALEQSGFVVRYVVAGKEYGFIPSFPSHQSFHKTERPSTIPAPPENAPLTVSAPLTHREPPVTDTAVTVTGTVTDKQHGRASKRTAQREDRPRGGLDVLPKDVCDAAWKAYCAQIGGVDYGRFRKALLPVYQSAASPPPLDDVLATITVFDELRAAEDPKWRAKFTPELWAGQFADYLRLARMPLVDEWGVFTERGVAAGLTKGAA